MQKNLLIFKTSEENNLVILEKKLPSVKHIKTAISLGGVMNEKKLYFSIHEALLQKCQDFPGQMEM